MLSRLGEVLQWILRIACVVLVIVLLVSGAWMYILPVLIAGGLVYSILKYIFTGK